MIRYLLLVLVGVAVLRTNANPTGGGGCAGGACGKGGGGCPGGDCGKGGHGMGGGGGCPGGDCGKGGHGMGGGGGCPGGDCGKGGHGKGGGGCPGGDCGKGGHGMGGGVGCPGGDCGKGGHGKGGGGCPGGDCGKGGHGMGGGGGCPGGDCGKGGHGKGGGGGCPGGDCGKGGHGKGGGGCPGGGCGKGKGLHAMWTRYNTKPGYGPIQESDFDSFYSKGPKRTGPVYQTGFPEEPKNPLPPYRGEESQSSDYDRTYDMKHQTPKFYFTDPNVFDKSKVHKDFRKYSEGYDTPVITESWPWKNAFFGKGFTPQMDDGIYQGKKDRTVYFMRYPFKGDQGFGTEKDGQADKKSASL